MRTFNGRLGRMASGLGLAGLAALLAASGCNQGPRGDTGGTIDPYNRTRADAISAEADAVTLLEFSDQVGQELAVQLGRIGDIRNALAGDPSPRSQGAKLETGRGIEVGHIFKLGTKYSEAMGLAILDDKQQKRSVIMGCYGIGVTRTMQAIIEQCNDKDGIVWPISVAPSIGVAFYPGDARSADELVQHAAALNRIKLPPQ